MIKIAEQRALTQWAGTDGRWNDGRLLCIHESGHAIAAVLAGAQIAACYARPNGEGGVDFSDITDDHPASPGISYWGIYAEAFAAHGGPPPVTMLREYMEFATPEDLACFNGAPALLRHIEPEIRFAMPMILDLAQTIYRRGSATHADIEKALGVGPDMPLAAVRSYLRQGIDPRTIRPAPAGVE